MSAIDPPVRDSTAEADRRLVQAIAAGSTDALAALYDRHAAVVFGLARRITGGLEDAEEVVQDVFTQVWRHAQRYDVAKASVAGWLVMLARTRAIDRLRARRARPDQNAASGDFVLSSRDPGPDEITAAADDARCVRQALAALPIEQRSVLELAYFEGLTQSAIAVRTETPLGTVKTRMRTAMAALRRALGRDAPATPAGSGEA